jgi:adenylate cyclase
MSLQAWATAESGEASAIAQLRTSLEQAHAAGAHFVESYNLILLAGVESRNGDPAAGLHLLDEVLASIEHTGSYWCKSEAYRTRGELLLCRPGGSAADREAAEQALRAALAVAQQQGAKALELRAATSLARLWQCDGRGPEARWLLAPICAGFTEGIDTQDLRAALALHAVLQQES